MNNDHPADKLRPVNSSLCGKCGEPYGRHRFTDDRCPVYSKGLMWFSEDRDQSFVHKEDE